MESSFTRSFIVAILYILFYRWKEADKDVKTFQKFIFSLIHLLSEHCKNGYFASKKWLFCTVKAALLHRKTAAFATSKRSYHFLTELSLQNRSRNSAFPFDNKEEMNLLSISIIGLISVLFWMWFPCLIRNFSQRFYRYGIPPQCVWQDLNLSPSHGSW